MEKWLNKVAVVTGASSGVGKDIALKLIDHGLKVVGCGRNFDNLMKVKNEIPKTAKGEFTPFKCDVSKEEDVLNLFKFVKDKFKELSILINSAGLAHDSPILHGKTEDWKSQIDINVLGLCMCIREAYPLIHENEKSGNTDGVPGHIININSLLGHSVLPYSNCHFYSATKFAVNAITTGTRQELGGAKSNIRVSQISPGFIDTNFSSKAFGENFDSQVKKFIDQPLQASDVSAAIIFVLSVEARTVVQDVIMRSIKET